MGEKSQRHIVYLWVLNYAHITRRSFYRKSGTFNEKPKNTQHIRLSTFFLSALRVDSGASRRVYMKMVVWFLAVGALFFLLSFLFSFTHTHTYTRVLCVCVWGRLNDFVLWFSERLLQRDLKSIVYLKIRNEIRIKTISIYDFFRCVAMIIHCWMIFHQPKLQHWGSRGKSLGALAN